MSDIKIEELRSQILLAPHPDLEPHIQRGALILVDSTLDLATVAWTIAQNNHAQVKEWLETSLLQKVGPESITQWKKNKSFFRFIIIQPFVVAQIEVQLTPQN